MVNVFGAAQPDFPGDISVDLREWRIFLIPETFDSRKLDGRNAFDQILIFWPRRAVFFPWFGHLVPIGGDLSQEEVKFAVRNKDGCLLAIIGSCFDGAEFDAATCDLEAFKLQLEIRFA